MFLSICFIIAFFYKKLSLKIHWKIFNLVITDCINMLGIWIYFSRFCISSNCSLLLKYPVISFINISRFDLFFLLFNIILPPFIYYNISQPSVFIQPFGAYFSNSQSSNVFKFSSECSTSRAYRQEISSTSFMKSFFPFSNQRTIKNS